jgi:hypothetical protein
MPMPEYGQNFVKPQSGGTGSWMAKLFGGISDDKRARQMAQIQYDLHVAKGTFDTGEHGTRAKVTAAAKAAGDDYAGERGFSREKRRAKFYEKKGVDLKDMATSSASVLSMQKKASFDYGGGPGKTPVDGDATDGGTNPTDGGTKPKKPRKPRNSANPGKPRKQDGTIAATVGAIKSGNIDFEQATGSDFGSDQGISSKLSADFGAHVTAGGNQQSYLDQFGPSGRRKRTKPNTPPPPPPPSGGKKPNKKTISSGGGVTEVRNSNVETGNRGNK